MTTGSSSSTPSLPPSTSALPYQSGDYPHLAPASVLQYSRVVTPPGTNYSPKVAGKSKITRVA
ncbi:hypothetical protein BGZ97_011926 [Linnemannia gamsii]|uniref:Uncharacterized protein n=1 Tax=Linnemannia gamsii TaxID=64522 RepID=A0A9P6R6T0_9FUNG|nr:hypothetical protein BGZ97_011926 [Linnemannia gamsii]